MKVRYDDEWKKINLINSSIKLNININVNSKNIAFVEKIEKILNEIELIEKYYISFFDNEITRYSILSNSTPDKLIKEFEKFNIKVLIKNTVTTLGAQIVRKFDFVDTEQQYLFMKSLFISDEHEDFEKRRNFDK